MRPDVNLAEKRRILQLETLYDLALALQAQQAEAELVEELLQRVVAVTDPAAAVAVTRDAYGRPRAVSTVGWEGPPPAGEALLDSPLWRELLAEGKPLARAGGRLPAAATTISWPPRSPTAVSTSATWRSSTRRCAGRNTGRRGSEVRKASRMSKERAEGRGSGAADGRGDGSFVVMLNGGADRRVQYFTAKAICEFWSAASLQPILDRLHAGENIVLYRAASRPEADALVERFAALGATVWVVEQREISGVRVF